MGKFKSTGMGFGTQKIKRGQVQKAISNNRNRMRQNIKRTMSGGYGGSLEFSDLKPVETPFGTVWTDGLDPIDPTDCSRWPDSLSCQGLRGLSAFSGMGVWIKEAASDKCMSIVVLGMGVGPFTMPDMTIARFSDSPECGEKEEEIVEPGDYTSSIRTENIDLGFEPGTLVYLDVLARVTNPGSSCNGDYWSDFNNGYQQGKNSEVVPYTYSRRFISSQRDGYHVRGPMPYPAPIIMKKSTVTRMMTWNSYHVAGELKIGKSEQTLTTVAFYSRGDNGQETPIAFRLRDITYTNYSVYSGDPHVSEWQGIPIMGDFNFSWDHETNGDWGDNNPFFSFILGSSKIDNTFHWWGYGTCTGTRFTLYDLEVNGTPLTPEPPVPPPPPPPLPGPPLLPPMDECCAANLRLTRAIHKWIGADPEQKIRVPKTLIEPPDKGMLGAALDWITPDDREITSLPDLLLWINEQNINSMGQWGQTLEIPGGVAESTNGEPVELEPGKLYIPDIATALLQILMLLLNLQDDEPQLKELAAKNLLESHMARQQGVMANYRLDALLKAVGASVREKKVEIPATFSMPAGETTGTDAIDTDREFKDFLRESKISIPVVEYGDSRDLKDDLRPLLEAAGVIMALHTIRYKQGTTDDQLKSILRNEVRKYSTEDEGSGDTGTDWDIWLDRIEEGFGNEGATDPLNPYGRSRDRRPLIREIGEDQTDM